MQRAGETGGEAAALPRPCQARDLTARNGTIRVAQSTACLPIFDDFKNFLQQYYALIARAAKLKNASKRP